MYSLGYAIRVIIRILRGERFRKATSAEKKEYAFWLNFFALLVIFYPWFVLLIEKYSHAIIWLWVMGFLIPAVVLAYWNKECLTVWWSVILSFFIIAVPVGCLFLWLLGTRIKFSPEISAVALAVYLAIIIIRWCVNALRDKKERNEAGTR